ncbi:hypothetical protein LC605_21175 [Nostoc sp. CHAB 5836]|uniref:hypothetical protein n=1 Tax=Nostoc sp. CHAB 5836 TaxID=2780404 RepID=UPI001E587E35|nr:hypothetical protein [Nostoc sp. CHAB 5836]MCC5617552.1 hypothetical protein [Nostoc sp. CHAB 5836]
MQKLNAIASVNLFLDHHLRSSEGGEWGDEGAGEDEGAGGAGEDEGEIINAQEQMTNDK